MHNALMIIAGILLGFGYRNFSDWYALKIRRYDFYRDHPVEFGDRAFIQIMAGIALILFFH